jgi:hypothetical protein
MIGVPAIAKADKPTLTKLVCHVLTHKSTSSWFLFFRRDEHMKISDVK